MRLFFAFLLMFSYAKSSPQDTLQKIPDTKILEVSFTQSRHLNAIPAPIISKGLLKLWPKKGFIWVTKSPFPSTLVISKKGLFQVENNSLKPLDKAIKNTFVFKALSAILSGDFINGLEGFDVTILPRNNPYWHLKLTPKNKKIKSLISDVEIWVHTQVNKVIIHRASGDYDEITLRDHAITTPKKSLSPQQQRWLND